MEQADLGKKTDKPQYNYPCQWKYKHGVRGDINANRCITIPKSVIEAEPNNSSSWRIIKKFDVCHNFWTGAL